MSHTNYTDVLLEDIRDQIAAVLEYVSAIPDVVSRLGRVETKAHNLESNMTAVKAAIVDVGKMQRDYEARITTLKTAVRQS